MEGWTRRFAGVAIAAALVFGAPGSVYAAGQTDLAGWAKIESRKRFDAAGTETGTSTEGTGTGTGATTGAGAETGTTTTGTGTGTNASTGQDMGADAAAGDGQLADTKTSEPEVIKEIELSCVRLCFSPGEEIAFSGVPTSEDMIKGGMVEQWTCVEDGTTITTSAAYNKGLKEKDRLIESVAEGKHYRYSVILAPPYGKNITYDENVKLNINGTDIEAKRTTYAKVRSGEANDGSYYYFEDEEKRDTVSFINILPMSVQHKVQEIKAVAALGDLTAGGIVPFGVSRSGSKEKPTDMWIRVKRGEDKSKAWEGDVVEGMLLRYNITFLLDYDEMPGSSVNLVLNGTTFKLPVYEQATYMDSVGGLVTKPVAMYMRGENGAYVLTCANFFDANIPKKPASFSVRSKKRRKLTLQWKKVSGAKGYEIQYSTSSKFPKSSTKTKKITKGGKTGVWLKGLKRRKTYYVRIRAVGKYALGKTSSRWITRHARVK